MLIVLKLGKSDFKKTYYSMNMRKIIFILGFQLFVHIVFAQSTVSKFGIEVQNDYSTVKFDQNYTKTSSIGFNAIYRITPKFNIILGEKYNLRYDIFSSVENTLGLTAGISYLLPIETHIEYYNLEAYLSGSSVNGQFINTFNHFYSDIGLKLLFKEIAFGSIGIRHNFDKPNRFSLNQNQSFSLVVGFGIRIDFTGINNQQK